MTTSRFTRLAAGMTLAAAAFAGGTIAANASGAPPVSTTVRTEILVSAKCFHYHQVTKTYRHWSTAAGGYVLYNQAPRVTTTDYIKCHA